MWLAEDAKFSSKFKYIELGRYVPEVDSVIRVMLKKHVPKIFELSDVEKYRKEFNNCGLYTSVFQYDNTDVSKATRLGSLYFDVDSDDKGIQAHIDALKLVDHLYKYIHPEAVRIYFTGKKGFHIECEAMALGITPSNNLPVLFREIANNLKDELNIDTFDFHVYDLRRMWRLPNSQHQGTGLYKVELNYEQLDASLDSIKDYAGEPHYEVIVPEQQFNIKANEWFREWQYKQEAKEEDLNDRIARFNKYGSHLIVQDDENTELEFQPDIFEKCPALMRLWEKSEKERDLTHEERLFLCSILSLNQEAQWYLHQILSNCDDYTPDRTQSHLNDWVRRRELGIGGKPYSCERANQAGVGCGTCDLEARDKFIRVGDKLVKTGEKAAPSPIRFGYKRRPIHVEQEENNNQILPQIKEERREEVVWEEERWI